MTDLQTQEILGDVVAKMDDNLTDEERSLIESLRGALEDAGATLDDDEVAMIIGMIDRLAPNPLSTP